VFVILYTRLVNRFYVFKRVCYTYECTRVCMVNGSGNIEHNIENRVELLELEGREQTVH